MSTTNIKTGIAKLAKKGWRCENITLSKSYQFKDFDDAFAFMMRCALPIAKMDHHPTWSNAYNKVHVDLTTHDTGGVSMKDVELAAIMDKIAATYSAKGQSK